MYFSYQTLVLAALALETALAQPAHRHMHQHSPRALSDVLGKRDGVDWDSPSTYKNPKTGEPFTKAQWACFVEKSGDPSCNDVGSGPAPSAAPAPAPKEKLAGPPSHGGSHPSPPKPSPSASSGSDSDSGPGAHIFNKGSTTETFVFYENNPYGQNTIPDDDKTITLTPGSDKFVSLPLSWKGHVQRGQENPTVSSAATWAEIQVQAGDGLSWGDISVQKGNDGPVMIISPTTGDSFGWDVDVISDAPDAAKVKTPAGKDALDFTEGGYRGTVKLPVGNPASISWQQEKIGQKQAYIVGGDGTQVAQSSTNILHVEFY